MNDQQLLRYSRHILLPQVDVAGQEKILAARALVVGLGGLGSPAAMYLCASGLGQLVLVDDDNVDESNLQRQLVHREHSIGESKVISAKNTLSEINSASRVSVFTHRLNDRELAEQIQLADVVLDCSDNFTTRKQLNNVCYRHKKPLVSAAAVRMEGQLSVFDFRDKSSPCYQCLYQLREDENLSCSENGVFAPVVGAVGISQALEALKLVLGIGKPLMGELALFDGESNRWQYLKFRKNPQCKICGT
ncbi:adenylyltransferase and sulfurtransferase [Alteromonadaceae bacterium Bs31]|nr:adenylyltransferase and sulfurtransferase [Alteromonadaceae bacterium Bs31]